MTARSGMRLVLADDTRCVYCNAANSLVADEFARQLRQGLALRLRDDGIPLFTLRLRCHQCGGEFGAFQLLFGLAHEEAA